VLDIVLIGAGIAGFVITIAYQLLCERL